MQPTFAAPQAWDAGPDLPARQPLAALHSAGLAATATPLPHALLGHPGQHEAHSHGSECLLGCSAEMRPGSRMTLASRSDSVYVVQEVDLYSSYTVKTQNKLSRVGDCKQEYSLQ